MKNLRTTLLCGCISVFSLFATAQTPKVNEPDYNKPRLFENFPEVIPVTRDNLNSMLNAKPGVNVLTQFDANAKTPAFEGKVVSAVSKYDDKLQTVFIQSFNYNGATLYISKYTSPDGATKYHGRMMNGFGYADLYVLQQKDNDFMLVKKNYYDVINE